MSPELQKVLTDALIVVIPTLASLIGAFAAWAIPRLQKNRKDNNALHEAKRTLEAELGVETKWNKETRKFDVTRRPADSSQTGSIPPQPLDSQGGKGS